MKTLAILVTTIIVLSSCSQVFNSDVYEIAGDNIKELESAYTQVDNDKREAVVFLVNNMQDFDLQELTADFIVENVNIAFKARNEFSWCNSLPAEVFYNEVLPYAMVDERRDNWRADFYNRFKPYVKDCTTINAAIDSVTKNIMAELKVEYNTKRKKADQSPYESMEQGMASCTGLSIILVDAFRAVGIPSRFAGIPMWSSVPGNHNWVEVLVDGQWYFTEYYPEGLDKSWFLARAGKTDTTKAVHRIYATSFKKTDTHFMCVWDMSYKGVPAVDVTTRYINVFNQQELQKQANKAKVSVEIEILASKSSTDRGSNRVECKVEVFNGDKLVSQGTSSGVNNDLNDILTFKLTKNTTYTVAYTYKDSEYKETLIVGNKKSEGVYYID